MTFLTPFSIISIVDFEQVNVCWTDQVIHIYVEDVNVSRFFIAVDTQLIYQNQDPSHCNMDIRGRGIIITLSNISDV